jgi:hypothetical protein
MTVDYWEIEMTVDCSLQGTRARALRVIKIKHLDVAARAAS